MCFIKVVESVNLCCCSVSLFITQLQCVCLTSLNIFYIVSYEKNQCRYIEKGEQRLENVIEEVQGKIFVKFK